VTQDDELYFAQMEELFRSPGWQHFIADITNNRALLREAVLGIESEKDLFRAQGRNQVYHQILTYQDLMTAWKKGAEEQEEAENDAKDVRLRMLQLEV